MKCIFGHYVAFLAITLLISPPAIAQMDKIEGIHGAMPAIGDTGIRMLTPSLIEIARINTQPSTGPPDSWNFVAEKIFTAPAADTCLVKISGKPVAHSITGFRRRVLYAPLEKRDLRIDNRLFIQLAQPAAEGSEIHIETIGWETPGSTANHTVTFSEARRSPAIHINQEGYQTAAPKQAMIGYFLGNLGELTIPSDTFSIIDDTSGKIVHTAKLTERRDSGFKSSPPPYQQVRLADFSDFKTPGHYRLTVPGLGSSLSFRVSDDMLMNFVRTYAQGLYNQRCGHAVELPFSRHTHAACHLAGAQIPTSDPEFKKTWDFISSANKGAPEPRLTSAETQYYPILKSGTIDVSGGHHDAGDYSRYTINSAQLLHHLVFSVDAFKGVGSLDNLGLPESDDGKSDILQEAKIEADFLVKMQDDDGGFFFLVYPKNRKYEDNVLPEKGDSQVVWPKNTAVTAAAVGALADAGSSPLFKEQFPKEAAAYLQKAKAGWDFLTKAIAARGMDGSYQKLTHYGDLFTHRDELAWAAAAMFAATGDPIYQQKLIEWYDPSSKDTKRWGFWELVGGYGCAARSYGFAVRNGKRKLPEMDANQLAKTEAVLLSAGKTIRDLSFKSAYGTNLDDASKAQNVAGWFFSSERGFDITVANVLKPSDENGMAVIGNVNFEFGCNPLNLSYVTGAGQRQQREIVHHYAKNDRRVFPPSGIPLGNLQSGFAQIRAYQGELATLNFPSDAAKTGGYPIYDRWADTFNVSTEFVVPQQARALGSLAAWAAAIPGTSSPWKPGAAAIVITTGKPFTASITHPGIDLTDARVTWESADQEPWIGGKEYTFTPDKASSQWIEAEAVLPDGRRFSASAMLPVSK